MTHFAFISPPYLGHLHPMAALAHELVRRGHRATVLGIADCEAIVSRLGLPFRPVGLASHPPGTLTGLTRRMGGIHGPFGLLAILRDVAAATDMLCRDLPAALREIGAECLVSDGTEAAAGLVAEHAGLPFVTVANALPLNREPGIPPPFVGWRYDVSPWGLERNQGGYRVSDALMRRHAAVISGWAQAWRLRARHRIDECLSPFAEVAQLVPGLDFPRRELPDTFHYVGPLRGLSLAPHDPSLPARDGRPRAFASLGTLQGGRVGLFRAIATAAERAGTQLVLAHGGGLTDEAAASLPGRPAAFAFVPQDVVLRDASIAILNGGLNTVLDALAAGVPIVAVPIAFEQGAIAARIERAGVGLAVRSGLGRTGKLARAMKHALGDPAFAGAAQRLAGEIAGAGGVSLAADIVERVAQTGRPVTRDMLAGSPGPAVQRPHAA